MKVISLISLLLSLIHAQNSLDINSWTLSNENGSIRITDVRSPIDVYSALYDNSIIDWPLKGYNDLVNRWVAYDNWTFTSSAFQIPPSNKILLLVSELDVYPSIILNNHLINTTTSEFSSSEVSIDSRIWKQSNNVLRIKFTSPPLLAKVISNYYGNKISPNCWPELFHGECHINVLRKTQSSFGWDWGPAIPTMGIRGKVQLRYTNKTLVMIKGVRFLTQSDDSCQVWLVEVIVQARVLEATSGSIICIDIHMENLQKNIKQCIKTNDRSVYLTTFNFEVNTTTLHLWWPFEMGTPALYKLEVLATMENSVLDRFVDYVGFRRVNLNQSSIGTNFGRIFRFEINCKPFFVKGTNWVPRSYLTSNWRNESYLEFLLMSVVDANINTIRLWGGGRPEVDSFYSIADRLGILVWHDLMFAGSLYPDDAGFYTQVNSEITDLLWRVQRHPSILLWSGNNEVELLIADGWYNTTKMDPSSIASYHKTFSLYIKPLVASLDPFTPFVLSSPSNGPESERDQGVSKDPQSLYYGDVHFYLYSGDLWDERSYPITRMTTEFGFQSYPSENAWAEIVSSENDFHPDGPLIKHRQHHPDGFKQIQSAIIQYFGKTEPRGKNNDRVKYSWFSYLSQINQAMILGTHINRLRSSQCDITPTGEGLTSGAMFWQLNDNWIAPSWSTIEATGHWKLGHHYIKKAFTKERIIVTVQDDLLIVRLVLSKLSIDSKYEVVIACVDLTQNVSRAVTGERIISIDPKHLPCNVANILSVKVSSFLQECRCLNAINCLVSGSLKINGRKVSDDETLIARPRDLSLPAEVIDDSFKIKIRNGDPNLSLCIITLKQKFVHLFVALSTTSLGTFSSNGLHLWKEKYNVTFTPFYHNQKELFNCSNLRIDIASLNELFR